MNEYGNNGNDMTEMDKEIIGITYDQQASQPGSHRGEYSQFYALKRGTPTSTVSTRTTQIPEEQSSLTRWDTTT